MTRIALVVLVTLGVTAAATAGPPLEEAPRQGYLAPSFTAPGLDGKVWKSADLRGKIVLLNFWASWCGPCLAEMPALGNLQAALPVTAFTVIAVAQDSETKDVTDFLKAHPVPFPVLTDDSQQVSRVYAVRGLPTSYLIDKRGVIVERMLGAREWQSKEWRAKIRKLADAAAPVTSATR